LVLTAAVLAGGLFAVGCGGTPTSGTGGAKTTGEKAKEVAKDIGDKTKEVAKDIGDKTKEVVNDLATKLKNATEGYNKETGVFDKALAALSKAKMEEKDAAKAATLAKTETEATGLLGDLKKKVGELTGLKDVNAMETAQKVISELIEKLKTLLKDYLPK
jgi:F420-0:gamma-glutamyl ligase-like protein